MRTSMNLPAKALAALSLVLWLGLTHAAGQSPQKWLGQDKFGLMITWGLYSDAGGFWKGQEIKKDYSEWLMNYAKIPIKEYEQLARNFDPVNFDAEKWLKLARDAGMKYVVTMPKHHEGFAMYHSRVSPYNIVDATPFKRDPEKEFAQACEKLGLKHCIYYSQGVDWHHPGGKGNRWDPPGPVTQETFQRYLDEKVKPQLTELLTNYGPIWLVWFDIDGIMDSKAQSQSLVDLVHRLQPRALASGRVGHGVGDFKQVGDNEIPVNAIDELWETTVTLNNSYGYKRTDRNWKTPTDIVRGLVNVVSKGGAYTLNIGPDGKGDIPEASVRILQEVGKWMGKYGESIYGTTSDPIGRVPWGVCTAKTEVVYLHVFKWPENGSLLVPGIQNRIKRAYLLADPRKTPLASERISDRDVRLRIAAINQPAENLDPMDTVVVLELHGKPDVDRSGLVITDNYRNELQAFDAKIRGDAAKYTFLHYHGRINSSIIDWNNAGDTVSWDLRTVGQGRFAIELEYAATSEMHGNEFEVVLRGDGYEQRFTGSVHDTGGMWVDYDNPKYQWHRYQKTQLGEVSIPRAGRYTLEVKPLKIARGPLMFLKSASLVPGPPP